MPKKGTKEAKRAGAVRIGSITLSLLIAFALAVAVLLSGCGGEEAADDSAGTGDKKLKVAAVMTVPLEGPWGGVVDSACKKAEAKGLIEYAATESIPPADLAKVYAQYASDDYDLIIGEAYEDEKGVAKITQQFPNTHFILGSSLPFDPEKKNVAKMETHLEQASYLVGMVAAGLTKTDKLGFIGGMSIPETNWSGNAFIAGALSLNPKIKYSASYVNNFYDPPKTKEMTLALVESGCDIIMCERIYGIEAAVQAGALCGGHLVNLHKQYADGLIASAVWNLEPVIMAAIEKIKNDEFIPEDYSENYITLKSGGQKFVWYTGSDKNLIPDDLRKKVEDAKQKIIDGTLTVKCESGISKSIK